VLAEGIRRDPQRGESASSDEQGVKAIRPFSTRTITPTHLYTILIFLEAVHDEPTTIAESPPFEVGERTRSRIDRAPGAPVYAQPTSATGIPLDARQPGRDAGPPAGESPGAKLVVVV
jgi:hypothetical protein